MYKDEFHSMDCSTMIGSVEIWSVLHLSLRKPAWLSLSLASTTVFSLSKMTLLTISPRIIPLQISLLWDLDTVPFFPFSRYFFCVPYFPNYIMQHLCRGIHVCHDYLGGNFIRAGSFPSLHVMNGFLYICIAWSFAVHLEYFIS